MNNILEKIIFSISKIFQTAIFQEGFAQKNGFLQKSDPRSKIICLLFFLITVGLTHNLPVIILMNMVIPAAAFFSKVPLIFFLKRVWIFIPFFTGIIVLPSLFNFFSPGEVFIDLGHIPLTNIQMAITYTGVATAALLILRVSASIALMMLLIITTRWMDILKALEIMRIPSIFIVILGMTYRYIFVLLNTADNLLLARKSRIIGKLSNKEERNFLISSLGVLFLKSFSLSEEIYLSMQSRGYRGKNYSLNTFVFKNKDILIIFICIIICLWMIFVINQIL